MEGTCPLSINNQKNKDYGYINYELRNWRGNYHQ